MAKTNQFDLIRDVLDKLMLDRNELPVGRVDGIVLLVRSERGQPQVLQLESGAMTLARRLNMRWARQLSRKLGCHCSRAVRIDWSKVKDVRRQIVIDLDGAHSRLLTSERWFRDRIIRHLPGNGMKERRAK
jgi:sporulation protein YlmC with PRC-barrel domain